MRPFQCYPQPIRSLALRPEGYSERQVLFQSLTPTPKKGALYPFTVSAVIRVYGPGYPANKFYGETCIGRMYNWVFDLSPGANGEWACDGTGGRLMTGLVFRLQPNGAYVDLDNKRGGRYTHNKTAATITVQGGFLDGQTGRGLKPNSFQISNTVNCEPWR